MFDKEDEIGREKMEKNAFRLRGIIIICLMSRCAKQYAELSLRSYFDFLIFSYIIDFLGNYKMNHERYEKFYPRIVRPACKNTIFVSFVVRIHENFFWRHLYETSFRGGFMEVCSKNSVENIRFGF